jgi:hypothetical protein
LFDSASRDKLRQAYAEAWNKHCAGSLLTPLEAIIVDVIGWHPEYQFAVSESGAALEFEPWAGEGNAPENPFLHMALHIAVREQLSIDRPPGVRDIHRRLEARYGDRHRADHMMMEALAETLWNAQRTGLPPDEAVYIGLARALVESSRQG